MKSFIQIIFLSASTSIMYSASLFDNATTFCNLDHDETTPFAYVIIYPNVDRLESTSTDMSKSVKPSSMGLLEPNRRHMVEVPLNYRSIHSIRIPMLSPGIAHIPIDDSDNISDVRPGFRLLRCMGPCSSQPSPFSSSDIVFWIVCCLLVVWSRPNFHFPC